MTESITPVELAAVLPGIVLVDVRKEEARNASGLTIQSSLRRPPFSAQIWWREFGGQTLVVFCVHGHEVSQSACSILNNNGVDARYLQGGFEAWRDAGLPTVAIETG